MPGGPVTKTRDGVTYVQEIQSTSSTTGSQGISYNKFPVTYRTITNVNGVIYFLTLACLWVCFILAMPLISHLDIINHPTDSYGHVCGTGTTSDRPYLLPFDTTTCDDPYSVACFTKTVCVSECPKKGLCPTDSQHQEYCMDNLYPFSFFHCPSFVAASTPNRFDYCAFNHKVKAHDPCYLGPGSLTTFISGSGTYEVFWSYLNKYVIEASVFFYCKEIILYIIVYFSAAITFSFLALFGLKMIVPLTSLLVVGNLSVHFYLLVKKSPYSTFKTFYFTVCLCIVVIIFTLKFFIIKCKIYRHRKNLQNIFLSMRLALTGNQHIFILASIVGFIFIIMAGIFLHMLAYPLLMVEKTYARKVYPGYLTGLPTYLSCEPHENECFFYAYVINVKGYISIIIHVLLFLLFTKTLGNMFYFTIGNCISCWYFDWHESEKGTTHTTLTGVERSCIYHLGTIFEFSLRHTFELVLSIGNRFHLLVSQRILLVPVKRWYLTETILYGVDYSEALMNAYNRKRHYIESVFHYSDYLQEMHFLIASLTSFLSVGIYDIVFFDSDGDEIILIAVLVICYLLSSIILLLNQSCHDAIYASILHELDEQSKPNLDAFKRPECIWPFITFQ